MRLREPAVERDRRCARGVRTPLRRRGGVASRPDAVALRAAPRRLARSCARWPAGCSRGCRAGISRRSRASRSCATSWARSRGARPGLVIGAHYDTLVKPKGFVGANNGAAGTAIVVQLGRDLRRLKRPRGAPRDSPRPLRRRGARRGPARGEQRLLQHGAARLARVRGGPPRADAGDGPARLRREQGTAAAPRGHLRRGAVGSRCARPLGRSGRRGISRTRRARRSSTTTRRSCGRASPRST